MNVAAITGICVAFFVAVAALFYLRGRSAAAPLLGRVLSWLAFAGTLGIAIAMLPAALDDSPSVPYLLAIPVLAALLAVIADVTGKAVAILTGVAALGMLAMGLFFAMFLTPLFLVPVLVLGAAAVAAIRPRGRRTGNEHEQHAVNP